MEHYIIDGPMDFLEKNPAVISLVGGGGKTTTMFALAEHYCRLGKRVLVTTTTHIGKPDRYYASDKKEVLQLWEQGHYAVVGQQEKKSGLPDKLKSLPEPELEMYMELADMLLIEADGVSYEIAKEALRLAAQKLPITTKFVVRRDYDAQNANL